MTTVECRFILLNCRNSTIWVNLIWVNLTQQFGLSIFHPTMGWKCKWNKMSSWVWHRNVKEFWQNIVFSVILIYPICVQCFASLCFIRSLLLFKCRHISFLYRHTTHIAKRIDLTLKNKCILIVESTFNQAPPLNQIPEQMFSVKYIEFIWINSLIKQLWIVMILCWNKQWQNVFFLKQRLSVLCLLSWPELILSRLWRTMS